MSVVYGIDHPIAKSDCDQQVKSVGTDKLAKCMFCIRQQKQPFKRDYLSTIHLDPNVPLLLGDMQAGSNLAV